MKPSATIMKPSSRINVTVAKVASTLACACLALFVIANYSKEVMQDPITVTVQNPAVNVEDFSQLSFCVRPGFHLKREENLPLGFFPATVLLPPYLPDAPDPDIERKVREWEAVVGDKEKFIDLLQPLFRFHTSDNTSLRVTPLLARTDTVCGTVEQPLQKSYLNTNRMSIESNRMQFRFGQESPPTPPEDRRPLVLSISFYKLDAIDYLGAEDMTDVTYGPIMKDLRAFIGVTVERHQYLNRTGRLCEAAPKGYRLPHGYLRRKCNVGCMFQAIQAARRCRPFQYDEGDVSLPFCHATRMPVRVSQGVHSLYSETYDTCRKREGCDAKRYCTEWKITATQVSAATQGKGKSEMNNSRYFMVNVVLHAKVAYASEHLMYSWESILGTVGGVIGVYLGLSISDLLVLLIDRFAAKRGRTKVDKS